MQVRVPRRVELYPITTVSPPGRPSKQGNRDNNRPAIPEFLSRKLKHIHRPVAVLQNVDNGYYVEAPANISDLALDEADSARQQAVSTQKGVDTCAISSEARKAQRSKKSSSSAPDVKQPGILPGLTCPNDPQRSMVDEG
jgi:hypothetical protein